MSWVDSLATPTTRFKGFREYSTILTTYPTLHFKLLLHYLLWEELRPKYDLERETLSQRTPIFRGTYNRMVDNTHLSVTITQLNIHVPKIAINIEDFTWRQDNKKKADSQGLVPNKISPFFWMRFLLPKKRSLKTVPLCQKHTMLIQSSLFKLVIFSAFLRWFY